LSKKKLKRVYKGRLEVPEGEVERGGVSADFGADGDGGEDVGWDADLVVREGAEGCDVGGGVVVEVFDLRDDAEGVAVDVLVLRTPDLLTSFVYNCV